MTLLPDATGGHLFSLTNSPLVTLLTDLALKNLRIGGATVDRPTVAIPANADIDGLFAFARAAGVKVICCYGVRAFALGALGCFLPLKVTNNSGLT